MTDNNPIIHICHNTKEHNRSRRERDAKWHLRPRTEVYLALNKRRDSNTGGKADNLELVLRDSKLKVLDELGDSEDRLHLDDPKRQSKGVSVGSEATSRGRQEKRYSRELPAKTCLHAHAERHQSRCYADISSLARPLVLDKVETGAG